VTPAAGRSGATEFRPILNDGHIGEPLLPASVSEILKRIAVFVRLRENDAEVISGHSMWVVRPVLSRAQYRIGRGSAVGAAGAI
jgi:hypothetical protein